MLDVVRFWLDLGPRRLPPRRRALPVRARRHQRREPPRDPRVPAAAAQGGRRPSSPAGCCSPRPTSGRRTSSTTSATATSATCASTSRSCRACSWRCAASRRTRSPRSWRRRPEIPDGLPVGHLPAQPRRADPRDGHRRGARLHVRRVRQGPAHEAQRRHRPPAGPAARQRPPRGRAVPRPAVQPARAARSCTTATRSGWATTSTSATATACAPRCSGRPTATAASRTADFAQLYLPPLMDPVYGYQAVNVEAERRNPGSFLHWVRRMLQVRKQHPVFGTGGFEVLEVATPSVLAYLRPPAERRRSTTTPCCASTTSRSAAQPVELFLSQLAGRVAGRAARAGARSRAIGELPYFVTLPPYGFFWFELTDRPLTRPVTPGRSSCGEVLAPRSTDRRASDRVRSSSHREVETPIDAASFTTELASLLPRSSPAALVLGGRPPAGQRAPGRHARRRVADAAVGCWSRCGRTTGAATPSWYQLPLGARPDRPDDLPDWAHARAASSTPRGEAHLFDALADDDLALVVLRTASRPTCTSTPCGHRRGEQSNTSLVLDERYILKVFRRVAARAATPTSRSPRPSARSASARVPVPVAVWRRNQTDLAVVRRYERSRGDGFELALTSLREMFNRRRAAAGLQARLRRRGPICSGENVAELHVALAEAFGADAGRRRRRGPPTWPRSCDRVAGGQLDTAADRGDLRPAAHRRRPGHRRSGSTATCTWAGAATASVTGWCSTSRASRHRPVEERRRPSSPLRDVAGMTRSFHYAAGDGAARARRATTASCACSPTPGPSATSTRFLAGYADVDDVHRLLPQARGVATRCSASSSSTRPCTRSPTSSPTAPSWSTCRSRPSSACSTARTSCPTVRRGC